MPAHKRPDKRSREELPYSNAFKSKIKFFFRTAVCFEEADKTTSATFIPYHEYIDSAMPHEIENGVTINFPIIYRGNCKPWDIGNLYLMYKWELLSQEGIPEVGTIDRIANDLMLYLRWIEHTRVVREKKRIEAALDGKKIHTTPCGEFYFPEDASYRVTYQYYRYLKSVQRQSILSGGTCRQKMNNVIAFYKGLISGGLISEGEIENTPFELTRHPIGITSKEGIQRILWIEGTKFNFVAPINNPKSGYIRDGGSDLRPLTEDEQEMIALALSRFGHRMFELAMYVSWWTGARIQTVGTLRVKHIYSMIKSKPIDEHYLLTIGEGTLIDSKNNKNYRLQFPTQLVKWLKQYVESDEHFERRKKSFFGLSDENYVFLTKHGTPIYTSKDEILKRTDPRFNSRIVAKDQSKFSINKGGSIRTTLDRFLKLIHREFPNFVDFNMRFHDMRATFGMNLVRDLRATGIKDERTFVSEAMGHESWDTTSRYLDYDTNILQRRIALERMHDRNNKLRYQREKNMEGINERSIQNSKNRDNPT